MTNEQNADATTGEAHSQAADAPVSNEAMEKAHEGFMGTVDKFLAAKPEELETIKADLVKTHGDYKTQREAYTKAKAEADKKAAEAAKNIKPFDANALTLPKDSPLTPEHLEGIKKAALEGKLDHPTAELMLKHDHELAASTLKGYRDKVQAEFKKYNEENIKTLEKEWGPDGMKEKLAQNTQVVEFYEKHIPGLKAEIERMGINNSVTASKFFNLLHTHLHMGTDKFEFGDKKPPISDIKNPTVNEAANKLFPKSMAKLNAS